MEMILENRAHSTSDQVYDFSSLLCVYRLSVGYTAERISEEVIPLEENELNSMALACSEKPFKDGWDNLSSEEEDYWSSLLRQ